ncbi:MAG TPA: hypothetical protein VL283_00465 [Candidatus Baltobacteraceae bacterium]|nr:hypothetical protein [Candidatus Baltobacteraceae bacterium]
MNALERLFEEQGVEIVIGMLIGLGFVIYLIVAAAFHDRRPPDKKDGP